MVTGTDCKLKEKLKTEIEPSEKYEAKAIIKIKARLLKERPKVLGSEVVAISPISFQFTNFEKFGLKPEL